MGCFMRRRVYVEFFEKNKCRITNSYQTKEFDFDKIPRSKDIDLLKLKAVNPSKSPFRLEVYRLDEGVQLEAYVVAKKDGREEYIASISLKDNKKEVRAVVWEG